MTTTTFVAGTPVVSAWLNDVNTATYKAAINVRSYGAVGDGVTDDTAAIQACITANRHVTFGIGTFKVTSSIAVPSNTYLDLGTATIAPNMGTNPLFTFLSAASFLKIDGKAGVVSGTFGAFLQASGTTATPSLISHYARFIWLNDITITGTCTHLLSGLTTNSVFIQGCDVYAANAILLSGKCVDTKIVNCIFFGSTAAAGTYGIKALSTGGGAAYHEGLHITQVTIDNFAKGIEVYDMFVMTMANSWLNAPSGKYAAYWGQPTTTQNEDINVSGCIFGASIKVDTHTGGAYELKIHGCQFSSVTGAAIEIANGANTIVISDSEFKNGAGNVGVYCSGAGNNGVVCHNLNFSDGTFSTGIYMGQSAGSGNIISNITGSVTGELWNHQTIPGVRKMGLTVDSTTQAGLSWKYNASDIGAGTYAVASTISTCTQSYAKGETGWIDVQLHVASGMTAATQRIDVTPPTGMSIPSGSGWAANYIYPQATAGLVSTRIPYYCTTDITNGALTLTNGAGSTLTIVNSHSRFGIVRDH